MLPQLLVLLRQKIAGVAVGAAVSVAAAASELLGTVDPGREVKFRKFNLQENIVVFTTFAKNKCDAMCQD